MVLHFPSKLTEEEEQLQAKYSKLRRKKKQLQDVTKPKQEPEHSKIKKPSEAKDAKEVAKKLLKTGAIKAIKKSLEKEKAKDEKVALAFEYFLIFLFVEHWWFQEVQGPGEEVEWNGSSLEQLSALLCHTWTWWWL